MVKVYVKNNFDAGVSSNGNMVSYTTELTVQWPSLRNRRRCFKICLHLAQQGRQQVITFKCDIEPDSANIFFDQLQLFKNRQ